MKEADIKALVQAEVSKTMNIIQSELARTKELELERSRVKQQSDLNAALKYLEMVKTCIYGRPHLFNAPDCGKLIAKLKANIYDAEHKLTKIDQMVGPIGP